MDIWKNNENSLTTCIFIFFDVGLRYWRLIVYYTKKLKRHNIWRETWRFVSCPCCIEKWGVCTKLIKLHIGKREHVWPDGKKNAVYTAYWQMCYNFRNCSTWLSLLPSRKSRLVTSTRNEAQAETTSKTAVDSTGVWNEGCIQENSFCDLTL